MNIRIIIWSLDLQTSIFGKLASTNHYKRLQCIFRCHESKRLHPSKSTLNTSTYFTPTIIYIISKFKRLRSPKQLLNLTWTCSAYNHLNDSYMHLNMGREVIQNCQKDCFLTNNAMLWPHVNATFQRPFLTSQSLCIASCTFSCWHPLTISPPLLLVDF